MGNAAEYRAQSLLELEALLEEARKGLFDLRLKRRETGNFEKSHLVKETRKSIARIMGVIGEKRRAGVEA
jgi:ribosomal protein L29